jgi:hypothetical protein
LFSFSNVQVGIEGKKMKTLSRFKKSLTLHSPSSKPRTSAVFPTVARMLALLRKYFEGQGMEQGKCRYRTERKINRILNFLIAVRMVTN